MSKLVLITSTLIVSFGLNAQTKIVEGSTLLPSKTEGAIVVLPNKLNTQKSAPKTFNNQGKEVKIPQSIYRSVRTITTSSKNTVVTSNYGSTIILPKGATLNNENFSNNPQQTTQSKPENQETSQPNVGLTTNWIAPNSNFQLNETVDTVGGISDEIPSLLTPVLKKYEQPKTTKIVETLDPKKVYPGNVAKQSLGLPATTKSNPNIIDLAPIDPKDIAVYNTNKTKNTTVGNNGMIDLAPLENTLPNPNTKQNLGMPDLLPINERGSAVNTKPNTGMIDLAPIEGGVAANSKSNTVMIDLAPIEGGSNTSKPDIGMPNLAPINDEVGAPTLADIEAIKNKEANKRPSTAEKAIQLPKGTILASQLGLAYIVKPAIPRVLIDSSDNNIQSFKPKAGGGFGMIDLAPIEQDANTAKFQPNNGMIDLAPIETTTILANQTTMIDLAPIEDYQPPAENNIRPANTYQAQTAPVYYQPQPKKVYTQTQKKWKPNPCPCAVPKRKWYPPKKRTYSYTKPAPQQPATVIKYIDRPRETIVYVPVQQQQQQKTEYKQPVQQEQPKDKFVYTDYTNTYKKADTYNKTCNCNNQQQTTSTTPKDPAQYYNPSNYVGLNAGPTSGDYPVNPTNQNVGSPMQYAFYVNKKGEYSVNVYNNYASVLISQNGRIQEYKINDQQTAANTPKYNYFGSAESIGGIPIEYNYNRTVNKIGNVDFTYDFEGFIKTIGASTVQYNSRSRISQVDNIVVSYNGTEAVGVNPPNTGRVYLSK